MASVLAGRMSALRLASPASTSAPSSSSSSKTVVVRASAPATPAQLATAPFNGAAAPSVAPLSLQVAEADTASAVVHRYVVLLNQNARAGTASTLTRSEVRGGGKKPYAQKGTGNARIGSRRTPLKPGGGVSFGPKPKDWGIKMNKKERRLAMATALQSAAADIVVVESAAVSEPKTKALVEALAAVGADPMKKSVLLIANEVGDGLQRAARNVERLAVNRVAALNASDVLRADKIVVEKGALAAIQEFYGPSSKA